MKLEPGEKLTRLFSLHCKVIAGIYNFDTMKYLHFVIATCTNGDLFLIDGWSEIEGRLEICYNNQWGTVCDDHWTHGSTEVACRQLGIQDTTYGMHAYVLMQFEYKESLLKLELFIFAFHAVLFYTTSVEFMFSPSVHTVTRLRNNIFSTASSQVPILLDDVECTGSETNLLSCPHRPIGQENCGHYEDISLRCG